MTKKLKFRVSSALKNIIGKDLITQDFIAVFELVKNSIDAYAKTVKIIFENDKLIIMDDGKGMNYDDLVKKWLFVAYSAKNEGKEDETIEIARREDYRNRIEHKQYYAGAKGIGRFSCDRLGKKLKLITKCAGEEIIEQINIDWEKFEENADDEFIDITVDYETPETTGYNNFTKGTILEISELSSKWPRDKILSLKRSLEKLINPIDNISNDNNKNQFLIIIEAKDELALDWKKKEPRNKVNGPVKNILFETLNVKTTMIHFSIDEKGDEIITSLVDRGTPIYKIKEINRTNPIIKNIKIVLFFLNHAAKINFKNKMGVRVVTFGSVFLYRNGFRVYPFGEEGKDPLGIDRRKQQGFYRYLGTRDLIGRIEIIDDKGNFKESSSRDGGLDDNSYYKELSKIFFKCLRRFESYVVDVQWSLKEYRDLDKKRNDISAFDNIASKTKILEMIFNLTNSREVELIEYNKDFLNIINEKLEEAEPKAFSNLTNVAKESGDDKFLKEIKKAEKEYNKLKKEREYAEKRAREEEEERKRLEEKLEIEKDKNTFLLATNRGLSRDAQGLIHTIKLVSKNVNSQVEILMRKINEDKSTKKDQLKRLTKIKFSTAKVLKISELITRSNFKEQSTKQKIDLVKYIEQYLETYEFINEKNDIVFEMMTNDACYWTKVSVLELSIVIDNLISNSTKAHAKKILIKFECIANNACRLFFSDDGIGLAEKYLVEPERIFELGVTDTDGSGIGLYTARDALKRMKGKIEFLGNNISLKGATFVITFG